MEGQLAISAASHQPHPTAIAAVQQNAARQARMAARCLELLDARLKDDGIPTGASNLPLGFLLEVGAICQLKAWERAGLRAFLPADLPTCADAVSDLHRRITSGSRELASIESASLSRRVLGVWLNDFSWAAPNLLEADVVLGKVEEDTLVDVLAHLLWHHRHAMPAHDGQLG
jgi:hypothetical protein